MRRNRQNKAKEASRPAFLNQGVAKLFINYYLNCQKFYNYQNRFAVMSVQVIDQPVVELLLQIARE